MGSRGSYSGLSALPAWILLDEDKNIVASVRAPDAEEARRIFKWFDLSGKWIRRAK